MIRLPFSTIELGPRDLDDFHRRRRDHLSGRSQVRLAEVDFRSSSPNARQNEAIKSKTSSHHRILGDNHTISTTDGSSSRRSLDDIAQDYSPFSKDIFLTSTMKPPSDHDEGLVAQYYSQPVRASESLASLPGNRVASPRPFSRAADENGGNDEPIPRPEEEQLDGSTRGEAENMESPRSSPLLKDDFFYGGFIESPAYLRADNPVRRSSPFSPNEASTLPHFVPRVPALQGPSGRTRLPISPLVFAQNASSSSPDRRLTTSLTPRVVERVAIHGTPGVIFTQPPRRPHTQPTTRYRHQTNSFSFDDSERSAVAYEQERASSPSSTDSQPRPAGDRSLREELRGSSLTSSRVLSNATSHLETEVQHLSIGNHTVVYRPSTSIAERQDVPIDSSQSSRTIHFTSPQLPTLTTPHSTAERSPSQNGSLAGSQPTSPALSQFASPTRSSSRSVGRNVVVYNPTSPVRTSARTTAAHDVVQLTGPIRSTSHSPTRDGWVHIESPPPYESRMSRTPSSGGRIGRAIGRVFSGRRPRTPSDPFPYAHMMTPATQQILRQDSTQDFQLEHRMVPRTEPRPRRRRQRGRLPSEQFEYSNFMTSAAQLHDQSNRLEDVATQGQDHDRPAFSMPTETWNPVESMRTDSAQSQDQSTQRPRTPGRSTYRVYDDSLPPSSQPQTPANLPESRHRSRFHPSFTMPTRRPGSPSRWARPSLDAGLAPPRVDQDGYELRPRYRGPGSPVGMRSVGFEGLFGGRENGDDEEMWTRGLQTRNGLSSRGGRRADRILPSPGETRDREDRRRP